MRICQDKRSHNSITRRGKCCTSYCFEEYRGQVAHYYIILNMNIPQTSSVVTAYVGVVTNKCVAHAIVVASTPVT